MQIDDFNPAFGERLESRNADSIGGYIIEKLSYIPKRGEILRIGAMYSGSGISGRTR